MKKPFSFLAVALAISITVVVFVLVLIGSEFVIKKYSLMSSTDLSFVKSIELLIFIGFCAFSGIRGYHRMKQDDK